MQDASIKNGLRIRRLQGSISTSMHFRREVPDRFALVNSNCRPPLDRVLSVRVEVQKRCCTRLLPLRQHALRMKGLPSSVPVWAVHDGQSQVRLICASGITREGALYPPHFPDLPTKKPLVRGRTLSSRTGQNHTLPAVYNPSPACSQQRQVTGLNLFLPLSYQLLPQTDACMRFPRFCHYHRFA